MSSRRGANLNVPAKKFKFPASTTVPVELGAGWEDRSWHNDSSACAWLDVPTKKAPKAVLVLWVQADDKKEWGLPDQGKYQLDFVHNGEDGWVDGTDKTLLITNDFAAVLAEVKKYPTAKGA